MRVQVCILVLVAMLATTARAQSRHLTNDEHSRLASAYNHARAIGDLLAAKRILVGDILGASPGATGYHSSASRLCYELGQYDEARSHFRKYSLPMNRAEEARLRTSVDDCYEELLNAAVQKRAPRWNFIRAGYPDLTLFEILQMQIVEATGARDYKLAARALAELEKLGESPHIVALERERLAKSIAAHEAYKKEQGLWEPPGVSR